MASADEYLARWQQAGLLDDVTAARIRAFEAGARRPEGQRWQVVVALTLGAVLLGAGVLLFVAAHWDRVSPGARLSLVLAALALLHLAGVLLRDRFAGLATALHAIGTIALGGAIAMVGQIFNMQSHWPAAVLLWALGALAGWWLLGDALQQVFATLLVPAWILSEFAERTGAYRSGELYLARMVLVLAAAYLTAFAHERRGVVRGSTFAAGAIALPVCVTMLSDGWAGGDFYAQWGFVPAAWRLAALLFAGSVIVAAWFLARKNAVPVTAAAVLAYALPWTVTIQHRTDFGTDYIARGPGVLSFSLLGLAAVLLAWWAVREGARALVNYAMLAFGAVVMWFYFSSVMDKLNRSLGLIGLGIVFLLGGYALEQVRRRLLQQMANTEAA